MIDTWTRTDNLPYFLDDLFSHIREEAECLGEKEEWEVQNFVREAFEKDFPIFFKDLNYEEVVYVEYNLFELGYLEDEETFPGYAVYIHFHETLVKQLLTFTMEQYPEYILSVI